MSRRTLTTRLVNELAQHLALRSAPPTSDPATAEMPGAFPNAENERTPVPEPARGILVYLVCFGIIATMIVAVFFGLGFFLLTYPDEKPIVSPSGNGGVEVELRPSDKDAAPSPNRPGSPDPATALTPSVPLSQRSEAQQVLPPADGRVKAGAALDMVANYAKKTEVGQHRHHVARKYWARLSRLEANRGPPPALSAPEVAWHWIVRSATNIVAALSPPPPGQANGAIRR
jgi:hypothetical protein